jgi:hypothetical protein
MKQLLVWMELGARLLSAGPGKWEDVVRHVRAVVEAQETINRVDRTPTIGGSRPRSRYLS